MWWSSVAAEWSSSVTIIHCTKTFIWSHKGNSKVFSPWTFNERFDKGLVSARWFSKDVRSPISNRWLSPDSSFTKTDRHDITEMLLKVALNTHYPHYNNGISGCVPPITISSRHDTWTWQKDKENTSSSNQFTLLVCCSYLYLIINWLNVGHVVFYQYARLVRIIGQ